MSRSLQKTTEAKAAPSQSIIPQRTSLIESLHAFGPTQDFNDNNRKPLVSQPPLIQPGLITGQTNDKYEQEVYQQMDQAIHLATTQAEIDGYDKSITPCPLLPSRCPFGGACHICPPYLRAMVAADRTPFSVVPPVVYDVLGSAGKQLDTATRAFMEPRLGRDFSQVRIHTDEKANEAARAVDSVAYTVGQDVVFDSGQYAPATLAGRELLAHELTHTIQQAGTSPQPGAELELGPRADAQEREAAANAAKVINGGDASVQRLFSSSSIRRLQRLRRRDTHAGLFEMTRHRPLGGPTYSPQAQYDVRIEFLPYRIVDCHRITMVQTLVSRVAGGLVHPSAAQRGRAITAAEGTEGVSIDRLSGRSLPYYGTTNAGATAGTAHFGSRTGTGRPDRAWIEDTPGFTGVGGSARTAGDTLSQHFETCPLCTQGIDQNAYYGCVSWGYDIDAANNFTEAAFGRVSKGTPSADFLAAARRWNAQTVPVATTDLPIPTHVTHNPHMRLSELNAEITRMETRRRGLAAGHADIPQLDFEIRVLRDIRDAIQYNEEQGYVSAVIMMIQERVGARQDGVWGYDTVRRVKIWQARHGLVSDGRVGPTTLSRMGIHRAGDYPVPEMSATATRVA